MAIRRPAQAFSMTDREPDPGPPASDAPYRVLARKYRPATFEALIGQDALVRTLTNAISQHRLAHAYMLTGVRGVGKTTAARILARALNCVGADGTGGPTPIPCGVCQNCIQIAEDRHMDVIEMDAASRTGVGDIRDLLDGVPFRPAAARFKIYIIDEVHMLSTQAFNALLKTLEEPPEHVKFVFATTEIRKVPVTVLSRCQRFDLRRVEAEVLARHLAAVAEQEKATLEDGALRLLARAADGSVRDGLSLLDQAIAHAGSTVGEATVRDMLGLADREAIFDLAEAAFGGEAATALGILADLYAAGADPVVILGDLLELVHWMTRLKVTPGVAEAGAVPEAEAKRGRSMAERLSMADVTRAWQILLKGQNEVRMAHAPLQAAEMVLIRLLYAAQLPSPADAIKQVLGRPGDAPPPPSAPTPPSGGGAHAGARAHLKPVAQTETPPAPTAQMARAEAAPAREPMRLDTFEAVVALTEFHREAILHGHLINHVHLVHFEQGRIDVRLSAGAPEDLAPRLARFLTEKTGRTWLVSVSADDGAPTLHDQKRAREQARNAEIRAHPLVDKIFRVFPEARIQAIRQTARGTDGEADGVGADTEPADE